MVGNHLQKGFILSNMVGSPIPLFDFHPYLSQGVLISVLEATGFNIPDKGAVANGNLSNASLHWSPMVTMGLNSVG